MHHSRRRKKQRPNYGKRLVDVCRSVNGFGFTISGQQPCILSCIVPNSPAETAGLRTGDFLISVNGVNVSKLPHEVVVQLINDSVGTIRLAIAENYFSDSSDDDIGFGWHNENIRGAQECRNRRPKYPHHKIKLIRSQNRRKVLNETTSINYATTNNCAATENISAYNIIPSVHASNDKDIKNVSAMVPSMKNDNHCDEPNLMQLEYRTVVGYLGTIEMPKQIVSNSKFQTVRSCIRKLRQEKRPPTVVLMQILPNCLKLYNSENVLLAKYPSARLNFVSGNNANANQSMSSTCDTDNRFFGLVTTSTYSDDKNAKDNWDGKEADKKVDVIVSNSCHVFVVDMKLIDHADHFMQAEQFSIVCTRDPVTGYCLEFPNTSEYVINLIKIMYNLNMERISNQCQTHRNDKLNAQSQNHNANGGQNSPQPSNHSELTTGSSNSDSGIGFHNDFTNVSDRIVVVDFPNDQMQQRLPSRLQNRAQQSCRFSDRPVPFNVDSVRNIRSTTNNQSTNAQSKPSIFHVKSRSLDYGLSDDLSAGASVASMSNAAVHLVRAMPDRPKVIPLPTNITISDSPIKYERYETIFGANTFADTNHTQSDCDEIECKTNAAIQSARSCDDLMISKCDDYSKTKQTKPFLASFDDVSLLGDAPPPPLPCRSNTNNDNANDDYVFLAPKLPLIKKTKKKSNGQKTVARDTAKDKSTNAFLDDLLSYKLSPKVFGMAKPIPIARKQLNKVKRRLSIEPKNDADKNVCSIKNRDFSVWGSLQDLEVLNRNDIGNSADQRMLRRDFMEPAYSEPDLLTRTTNNSSPFRRWGQSSFRSRSNDLGTGSLTIQRPSSLIASENDVYAKTADNLNVSQANSNIDGNSFSASSKQSSSRSVQDWVTSFEKLLEDDAGLHTFAVFLQKEFSAENIYFWTACERYRKIPNQIERSKEANTIFAKHLATGSLEPVNVDSKARSIAEERLNLAEQDLFLQAQKQIFNLMKFDSYQRFIRSDLYKTCLKAEQEKKPLPYPGDQLDLNLRTSNENHDKIVQSTKLKKSLSNAEDRRRKSLLPWHRKMRCKSKDRNDEQSQNAALKKSNAHANQSQNDIHSSRSSLSSFDVAISSRTNGTISPNASGDDSPPRSSLCRVILSDGATTIVQTRFHENIRGLVDRLLEKRGIHYQAYEGFVAGTNKPIDLSMPSTSLAGKEVLIEQRVLFKLDLPNKKIISVKSKPSKLLSEVLKPILHKYNYQLDLVTVYKKANEEVFPLNANVTSADGLRLHVVLNDAKIAKHQTLNEITNKVFNELMQRKTESEFRNVLAHSTLQSTHQHLINQQYSVEGRSDDWCSESSSGNFGKFDPISCIIDKSRTSTTPISSNVSTQTTNSNDLTLRNAIETNSINNGLSNDDICKKPLIAKWKSGVRLQNASSPSPDSKDLLEGLKRAQRFRLEDQRGTEINFELPDFLKDNSSGATIQEATRKISGKAPQPTPRTTINRKQNDSNETDNEKFTEQMNIDKGFEQSHFIHQKYNNGNVPPPLPPKPKIKLSPLLCAEDNKSYLINDLKNTSHSIKSLNSSNVTAIDKQMVQSRKIYFDRVNSSFV